MSDLIHKIVGVIIEAGQSDTTKFKLGETIRYSPSEILEILKQHESEIFGEESSTQPNASNVLNALDCISRAQALNNIRSLYPEAPRINFMDNLAQWKKKYSQYMECEEVIKQLPPAQPEREWIPCSNPPKHHRDVIVRGTELIGNVTVHKVMQWDVDTWRPTNYAPSIRWEEWSEI